MTAPQDHRDPDRDDLTAEDLQHLFGWLPFDWRWLLRAWLVGVLVGVFLVLWFLVFIAGPMV